jgi:hypothetical protein
MTERTAMVELAKVDRTMIVPCGSPEGIATMKSAAPVALEFALIAPAGAFAGMSRCEADHSYGGGWRT